ncbi:MAG: competence type IV pilus minor pilin ComGF [Sporolactobacillus sp.]
MKNQKGFTLLSMMLALSIMAISLILVVSVTKELVNRFNDQLGLKKDISLFFSQTALELHYAQSVHSTGDGRQLILDKNGTQVSYQWQATHRIIRQVNGSGYEIVLQHVSRASFLTSGSYIRIEVTDDQGHVYDWSDKCYLQAVQNIKGKEFAFSFRRFYSTRNDGRFIPSARLGPPRYSFT